MSEKLFICKQENYIFVLPEKSSTIFCYYKEVTPENLCDKYLANSNEEAKTVFDEIKGFKHEQPTEENFICEVTEKPCNPNDWFCHRDFVALRFVKSKGKINRGCHCLVNVEETNKHQEQINKCIKNGGE